MPFCPNCGIPVEVTQKFCPNCGQRLGPVPTPPQAQQAVTQPAPSMSQPVQAPPPQAASIQPPKNVVVGERIVSIVPNLKKPKSFGRWDIYNLIVTERQCIFAILTSDMLNKAIKEANEQGKQQGKGFMDRWGDQLSASMGYWRRYETMDPASALNENKENFSFDRSAVKKANVDRKQRQGQGKNAPRVHYWEVTIETPSDKYKFESDVDPSEQVTRAFD